MKLLLFAIPAGLLFAAHAHESFILLMTAICTLFVAAAVNCATLRNSLLVFASVAFTWTMAEVLLDAMYGGQRAAIAFYEHTTGRPAHVWQLHEEYGALPRPGQYDAIKQTEGGQVVYEAKYTIGKDGFRYTPQSQEPRGKNAYFLGDSATFGEGLDDDETLPFHWAALNPEYAVTNLAMSAWGLHQAYVVWRDLILEEDALVVVQTAPWQADRSACIPEFSTFSPRFELDDGTITQNGQCRVITGNPLVERVLKRSQIVSRVYDAFHYDQQARKFELYVAIVREMRNLARARGQCFTLAFNKALDSYFEQTDYNNQRILELLRATGVEVMDVTLADRKENLDPSYYIADDGHPSDKANRAKARLLSAATSRCTAGEDTISKSGDADRPAAGSQIAGAFAAEAGAPRSRDRRRPPSFLDHPTLSVDPASRRPAIAIPGSLLMSSSNCRPSFAQELLVRAQPIACFASQWPAIGRA